MQPMSRMLVLAYGGRPSSHAHSITPQGGGRIHLCGVLYTDAGQAVHSRGCGSGCGPGWRAVSAIGHVDVSRGVRAPKSEKRYTTPRSDFRFVLNRSQWRDRAGFAPASTSRMRAFYFRIPVRHYQAGASDDLSARCGSVRACALLIVPFRSPLLHFAYRSRNWRKQCQLLEVSWRRSEEDPADHLRFLRAWIGRPFFHWSALDRGDLTVLKVGIRKRSKENMYEHVLHVSCRNEV
jgi:hypothetical protein